jgi:hypothetical protein
MNRPELPPGWPPAVAPPGSPDWERTAVGWLFEQCPPDYRGYPVLARHPVLLARLAGEQVAAAADATRQGLTSVRAELAGTLPPEAVEAAVDLYEREQLRLETVARGLAAVARALRGERWVPRL